MAEDPVERLRAICLALPEVTERVSHGAPTRFVRDKRTVVTAFPDGHHHNGFPHLWCAAPPGAREEMIDSDPDRFFRPPYVGHRGWLGVRLDGAVDWDEIEAIREEAYRVVAPKTLVRRLDERAPLSASRTARMSDTARGSPARFCCISSTGHEDGGPRRGRGALAGDLHPGAGTAIPGGGP